MTTGHRTARRKARDVLADESGATAIEYGLIAALIFLAIVTAVTTFSNEITNMFNTVSNTVQGNV